MQLTSILVINRDKVKWTPFLGPGVKLEAGRSV